MRSVERMVSSSGEEVGGNSVMGPKLGVSLSIRERGVGYLVETYHSFVGRLRC